MHILILLASTKMCLQKRKCVWRVCIYLYPHQHWMLPPSCRQSMGWNGIWVFYSAHSDHHGFCLFCPWVTFLFSYWFASYISWLWTFGDDVCYTDFHPVRCLCIFSLSYKSIKFLVVNSDSLFLWHFVSCLGRYFPPQLYGKQTSLS